MNHYYCSDGTMVTQSQIDYRLKKAKEKKTQYIDCNYCRGCMRSDIVTAFAHIVPKARAKTLHRTELIWDIDNMFLACHNCNSIAENVSSAAIRKLNNFGYIKEYMKDKDPERYQKLVD